MRISASSSTARSAAPRRPPRPRRGRSARRARKRLDPRAPLALDQHLHRAVGQAQQLDDRAERADVEDVVGRGSLVFAFFCAARKIVPCRSRPCSCAPSPRRAQRSNFSRPTKSGTTMCGNTMMSRRGNSGSTAGRRLASRLSSRPKNIRFDSTLAPSASPRLGQPQRGVADGTPSSAKRKARVSTDCATACFTRSAPPWPALRSMRNSTGCRSGSPPAPRPRTFAHASGRPGRRGPPIAAAAAGRASPAFTWW